MLPAFLAVVRSHAETGGNVQISILVLMFALVLLATVVGFSSQLAPVRRGYFEGIMFWSRVAPALALGIHLLIITISVVEPGSWLSLRKSLSLREALAAMAFSVFLFSPWVNLAATGVAGFLIYKISGNTAGTQSIAPFMSLSSLLLLAIMGDYLPWIRGRLRTPQRLNRYREVALTMISFSALGMVFATIVKLDPFARWLIGVLGISLSKPVVLGGLCLLLAGWLLVALGIVRHLALPLMGVPSVLVLAFVSNAPQYVLIVPFTMCMTLALVGSDRRLVQR